MIRRVIDHLRRLRSARRFGISYRRRAGFVTPRDVTLHGKALRLEFPSEAGCEEDFRDCFIDDYYGLARLAFVPRTILDVGANVGFFSIAARGLFPGAVVHAYEPNPRVLPCLAHHAHQAGFAFFPEAVGAEQGSVEMLDPGDSNAAMTRDSAAGTIRKVAFATAIERRGGQVDLAKINCEGAEWELFTAQGCWSRIAQLRFEYHLWGRRDPGADAGRTLATLGFRILRHQDWGNMGLIWAERAA